MEKLVQILKDSSWTFGIGFGAGLIFDLGIEKMSPMEHTFLGLMISGVSMNTYSQYNETSFLNAVSKRGAPAMMGYMAGLTLGESIKYFSRN